MLSRPQAAAAAAAVAAGYVSRVRDGGQRSRVDAPFQRVIDSAHYDE